MLARRPQVALRHLDDAHRILRGDELLAAGLLVALGAAQARQDERGASRDQMRSVELGRDVRGQSRGAQRRGRVLGVRRRGEEIAAESKEDLGFALVQRMDRIDGVEAMRARRGDAGGLLQRRNEGGRRPLPDAHGAIALDVRMAAHRADARAGLADGSAQKQHVDDLADVVDRVLVLRQPHRPADDDPLVPGEHPGGGADLRLADAAVERDFVPGDGAHVVRVGEEVLAAAADESLVDAIGLENGFADALEERDVAVDADLQEQVGELRRGSQQLLRMPESEKAGLAKRVHAEDRRAPALGLPCDRVQSKIADPEQRRLGVRSAPS